MIAETTKRWLRGDAVWTEPLHRSGKFEEEWYCFGQTLLRMACEDRTFSTRFNDIYGECAVEPAGNQTQPRVEFRVVSVPSDSSVLAVSVTPGQPDGADFLPRLIPQRQYLKCRGTAPGRQMLAVPEAPEEAVFAFGPSELLVARNHPWQNAIALYAISNAIRLQAQVPVFHAASVGIEGRGILLSGAKGSGKTTLSLYLASRGHSFLGDEWAAVSSLTGELLPLRRAASIRPGPHPAGLDEYLRNHTCDMERLPDGTERVRVKVGAIFPQARSRIVPLTDIFSLHGFSSRPRVERLKPSKRELPHISPLLASVWGHAPGERALDLLRTLGKARWWNLEVGGSPEETAELIEQTVKEDIWD